MQRLKAVLGSTVGCSCGPDQLFPFQAEFTAQIYSDDSYRNYIACPFCSRPRVQLQVIEMCGLLQRDNRARLNTDHDCAASVAYRRVRFVHELAS